MLSNSSFVSLCSVAFFWPNGFHNHFEHPSQSSLSNPIRCCSIILFVFSDWCVFHFMHLLSEVRDKDRHSLHPKRPTPSSLLRHPSDCLSFILLSSLFHLSFLSSSLLRSSDVNVLFTFSISLIAFAPSSPILLSIIYSSFSFSFSLFPISLTHIPDSVMSMWCSFSAFHSLLLLLQLLSDCLSFTLLSLSLSISYFSDSLYRFNVVNVVFTFSISLIAFAPSAPM